MVPTFYTETGLELVEAAELVPNICRELSIASVMTIWPGGTSRTQNVLPLHVESHRSGTQSHTRYQQTGRNIRFLSQHKTYGSTLYQSRRKQNICKSGSDTRSSLSRATTACTKANTMAISYTGQLRESFPPRATTVNYQLGE